MLLDCLFHVVNGRVKSTTENYAKIGALHLKKEAWAKIFLLMELYCGSLLVEDKSIENPALSQQKNKVVEARRIDKLAIAALAKEKELLSQATHFLWP